MVLLDGRRRNGTQTYADNSFRTCRPIGRYKLLLTYEFQINVSTPVTTTSKRRTRNQRTTGLTRYRGISFPC